MGALERLQGYSANGGASKSFEQRLEEYGFKLFNEDGTHTELKNMLDTDGNQRVHAVAGGGKALANDTAVKVVDGWKNIGQLSNRDKIIGTDGSVYSVLGVFPQGLKDKYRVSFSTGYSIIASPDHLWGTADGETITTLQLKEGTRLPIINCGFGVESVPHIDEKVEALVGIIKGQYDETETYKKFVGVRSNLLNANWTSLKTFLELLLSKLDLNCYKSKATEPIFDWLKLVAMSCGGVVEDGQFVERSIEVTGVEDLHQKCEMTCISVDSPDKLFIVEGLIPTHNTTAMTFKIIKDLVSGEATCMKSIPNGTEVRVADKVWVCTFLRSGAAELEASLAKWQKNLGYMDTTNQIVFSTLDAEFKRCLNAMGIATNIASASTLSSMMRKAVDSCNIKRSGGYALANDDYKIIEGIITYYRGRLDDSKYSNPACEDYEITPSILDLIVKQFANLRKAEGVLDFDEITELLYQYLYVTPNPAVQDFVANRYNYIYIDEFQDTSQMQYAVLKFYARGHLAMQNSPTPVDSPLYTGTPTRGKIVVVGDVSQCLPWDTQIKTKDGVKYISEVKKGDEIEVVDGHMYKSYDTVHDVICNDFNGKLVKFTFDDGSVLKCTTDHKVFIQHDSLESGCKNILEVTHFLNGCEDDIILSGVSVWENNECINAFTFSLEDSAEELVKSYATRYENEGKKFIIDRVFCLAPNFYASMVNAREVKLGDRMLATSRTQYKVVVAIEEEEYVGSVYDINMRKIHNFSANGVFVHNCIYSFKGSDSKIIAKDFINDFAPTDTPLSYNYRCPDGILNPVIPSIHLNSDSASQEIKARGTGGVCKAYSFPNYRGMLKGLCSDLTLDMNNGLSAVVLCRTNYDGLLPALILETEGKFNFGVSGDKMTLNNPLPRKLIGVASLFTERSTPAVRSTLELLCGRRAQWEVKGLIDMLKANNKNIWQIPDADLEYSCPSICELICNIKKVIMVNGVRDREKEVGALKTLYQLMLVDVFGGDSAYCESARAVLEVLIYILDNNSFSTVNEFLEEIELLNDKLGARLKKSKVPILISTVHEFKGKERDSVYVWNDSDNVFPSSKCDVYNKEQLEEERRVHYIACTRAKQKETIYTIRGKEGMFLREMDLPIEFCQPEIKKTL